MLDSCSPILGWENHGFADFFDAESKVEVLTPVSVKVPKADDLAARRVGR